MRIVAVIVAFIACASTPRAGRRVLLDEGWRDRVKERFMEAWKPEVTRAALANDPTGCLYSTKDRRTVLSFRVGADGTITGATVTSGSGVQYLDVVAIAAVDFVHKLDPPSPTMLDGRSEIELPFAFTLQGIGHDCTAAQPQRR